MQASVFARVTSFGQGRFDVQLPADRATVAEALRLPGVEVKGRRLAVNGGPARLGSAILEGDEISVVPKVHGG